MKKIVTDKAAYVADFYKKHPVISHILLIIVLGLIIVWLTLVFLDIWTDHGETSTIPDVREMSYDNAVSTLQREGFDVEVADSVYDATKRPGTVLETWPRAGAVVKPGREVFLTITAFQTRKVVVNTSLTNVPTRQAMSYLESLGITNVRLVSVPSQFADLVVGAKYNGKEIKPGMQLPINALVILEVGTVPTVTEVDASDDASASSTQHHHQQSSGSQGSDDEATSSFYD